MHRPRGGRARRLLAAALLSLALGGCESTELTIEIPSFGDGNVEGLWLWKLSETTGQYERSGRIALSAPQSGPEGETLDYLEDCSNGRGGIGHRTWLERSPGDPATVTVALVYIPCDGLGGTYRASAYNQAGESALSATAIAF
jgi:hypothetical protein